METLLILGSIILSFVVASIAKGKNRSYFGWLVFSLFFSPVVSGLFLMLAGRNEIGPSPDTHVKCPDCAELILRDARVCKHCGCKLVPQ